MNKEEDYASDSDQSDDDFCLKNAAGESCGSEAESEDSETSNSEEDDIDGQQPGKERKKLKKQLNRSEAVKTVKETETTDGNTRRRTRQTDSERHGQINTAQDKDELKSDEETEKSRTDSLWADFLTDVNNSKEKAQQKVELASVHEKHINGDSKQLNSKQEDAKSEVKPKQQTIVEVLDFAGEQICVEKTVNKDSVKEKKTKQINPTASRFTAAAAAASTTRASLLGLKRPLLTSGASPVGAVGGLGSIINQLGKKKKMSVLEKSQMDWKSFKHDEGIEEQLQTFNKGKDGFLERQDFLQRTDVRQFEIEKNMRQARRQN